MERDSYESATSQETSLDDFAKYEDGSRRPLWRVAVLIAKVIVSEWTSRTWFGKLWYPLWFVTGTIAWIIAGPLLIVWRTTLLLVKVLGPMKFWDGVIPPTYKEGRKNE